MHLLPHLAGDTDLDSCGYGVPVSLREPLDEVGERQVSDVLPFDPKRRRKGQPPTADIALGHGFLSGPTKRAQPGARELAAEQAREENQRWATAHWKRETQRLLAEGTPVPARITMALDLRGLDGPEVDTACGAVEPAVDMWECGVEVPTGEQVKLLAELTGFPVRYFYMPVEPGPLVDGLIICWTDGRGCQRPEPDYVDERGVLHYGGEPPRTPPKAAQGALF